MSNTESADRVEQLRKKLLLPREVFLAKLEKALKTVSGGEILNILIKIRQALSARAPTSRERALVDALLLHSQTDGIRPQVCTCIRCGVTASIVATALSGFACCGSCWLYLDRLHGTIDLRMLDVDIDAPEDEDLSISVTTVSMDGVELC